MGLRINTNKLEYNQAKLFVGRDGGMKQKKVAGSGMDKACVGPSKYTMHRNINVTPYSINFWYRDKKKSYISYEKNLKKLPFRNGQKIYGAVFI